MGAATSTLTVTWTSRQGTVNETRFALGPARTESLLDANLQVFLCALKFDSVRAINKVVLRCANTLGLVEAFEPNEARADMLMRVLEHNEPTRAVDTGACEMEVEAVVTPAAEAHLRRLRARMLAAMQPNHRLRSFTVTPGAQARLWDNRFLPLGLQQAAAVTFVDHLRIHEATHAIGIAAPAAHCLGAMALVLACARVGVPCRAILHGRMEDIDRETRRRLDVAGIDLPALARGYYGAFLNTTSPFAEAVREAGRPVSGGAVTVVGDGIDHPLFVHMLAAAIRADGRFRLMQLSGFPARVWVPVRTGVVARAVREAFADTSTEVLGVPVTAEGVHAAVFEQHGLTRAVTRVAATPIRVTGMLADVTPSARLFLSTIAGAGGTRVNDLVFL